jgi:molecular chaperone GrpE
MFKKTRSGHGETEKERDAQAASSSPLGGGGDMEEDDSNASGASGRESEAEARRTDESELEAARRESQEHLQNWKRATADYQNLRRRLQADIDAASQRSKQPLLLELLLVLDYLEMALKTPCTTSEGKNLAAGVELTRSVLLRTLEGENVLVVPETGRFDPAVHQAVERVETREHESGTLLGTLRRGYTYNGQVLRPAQVRVAVEPASDLDADGEAPSGGEANTDETSTALET